MGSGWDDAVRRKIGSTFLAITAWCFGNNYGEVGDGVSFVC